MPPPRRLSARAWAELQERYDRTSLRTRSEVGADLPIPPPRKRIRLHDETSLLSRAWVTLRLLVDEACRTRQFGLSWCVHPRVAEDRRFLPAAVALFRDCDVDLFGNNIRVAWGTESDEGIEEEDEDTEE